MIRGLPPSAIAVAIVLLAGGSGAGQTVRPAPDGPVPAPGEGVICAEAIYTVIAEVGAQCRAGEDPAFQAELKHDLSLIDAYILKNSKTTPAQLDEFKRVQGHKGAPKAALCRGDALQMYDAMKRADPKAMSASIQKTLALPGEPTWGTCL